MLRDREQQMMEDRGWEFDGDETPVKIDRTNGYEIAREGDDAWDADLAEVKSLL